MRKLQLCDELDRSSCGNVLFNGYLPPPGTVNTNSDCVKRQHLSVMMTSVCVCVQCTQWSAETGTVWQDPSTWVAARGRWKEPLWGGVTQCRPTWATLAFWAELSLRRECQVCLHFLSVFYSTSVFYTSLFSSVPHTLINCTIFCLIPFCSYILCSVLFWYIYF